MMMVLGAVSAVAAAEPPLVVAHRGNSSAAPENTLAAVQSALHLNPHPHYVEIDVHASLDGQLVVSHDGDTRRTTGNAGLIREQSYEALKKLDAGYPEKFGDQFQGEPLPTLETVLDAVKDTPVSLMIEIKQLLLEEPIIQLLRQRGELERHVIAGFEALTVYRAKQLAPQVKTLFLVNNLQPETVWRAQDVQADIIGVNLGAEPGQVAAVQKKGFQVWVWTVDEPEAMTTWANAGVNAIISNQPALVFKTLNSHTR
jgi:glycerophosphoryl diester phosphodiesterase